MLEIVRRERVVLNKREEQALKELLRAFRHDTLDSAWAQNGWTYGKSVCIHTNMYIQTLMQRRTWKSVNFYVGRARQARRRVAVEVIRK